MTRPVWEILADFKVRYQAWARLRTFYCELEEAGNYPAPDEWEASDETGIAILRDLANELGFNNNEGDTTSL